MRNTFLLCSLVVTLGGCGTESKPPAPTPSQPASLTALTFTTDGGTVFTSATPAVVSAVPGAPAQFRFEASLAASDGSGIGIHGRLDAAMGTVGTLTLVNTEANPGMANVSMGKSFPPPMLSGTFTFTLTAGKVDARLDSDPASSGTLSGIVVLDCVKPLEGSAPGTGTGTTTPIGTFTSDEAFSSPFCHAFRSRFQP
jgi:hypothetical protein